MVSDSVAPGIVLLYFSIFLHIQLAIACHKPIANLHPLFNYYFQLQMRFVVYYHEDHTIDEAMYDDILNVESIDFREYPRVSIMREELYSEATIL